MPRFFEDSWRFCPTLFAADLSKPNLVSSSRFFSSWSCFFFYSSFSASFFRCLPMKPCSAPVSSGTSFAAAVGLVWISSNTYEMVSSRVSTFVLFDFWLLFLPSYLEAIVSTLALSFFDELVLWFSESVLEMVALFFSVLLVRSFEETWASCYVYLFGLTSLI